MFGRKGRAGAVVDAAGSVTQSVADAASAVGGYFDPLAQDEKLRQRLVAAIAAGAAAQRRARRQAGLRGLALRLAGDPVLRAQVAEMVAQLQGARGRVKSHRSHKLRNVGVLVAGAGIGVAVVPAARRAIIARLHGPRDQVAGPKLTSVEEEIEVAVPVTTAYNQWTQFEEFPRFMEGVDQVRQLDDTLLHWAATVGGKHVEWDAKILEQEPDRRITWESTDGKQTRGTVSFQEAGPARSRIRLHMSYPPEGVAEKVGSAIGIDNRRVRGDLQRFRDLIEAQQAETGAWRGEIKGGSTIEGSGPGG